MTQRELPGIRKTDGQPENEFIHFLICPAVFRCALCAQHTSEAGCPEAVDYDFVSHAVSNFYGDKRRFSASLLTQKRSVSSSPANFCLCMVSIRVQYKIASVNMCCCTLSPDHRPSVLRSKDVPFRQTGNSCRCQR